MDVVVFITNKTLTNLCNFIIDMSPKLAELLSLGRLGFTTKERPSCWS